ncbi:hypothetical protein HJFPF1_08884 [Paramyrothecium foliicola]|nr:hypothetical protein HJFPF1_08884 [Paramyrothecium foliicola]
MPYNTRRKSLSLPSLGIHIPVTHAARAAASKAAARSSSASFASSTSSSSLTTPSTSIDRSTSPESHPSKRLKRVHGSTGSVDHAIAIEQTPPPSPPAASTSDVTDVATIPKIDLEGINDDIVEAVIVQLQSTGNRPHLVKELEMVLSQQLTSVQQSANPCAIISSRLASYLKRSCWTALAPCPLAKELEAVHPRRTYFFLTTCPRQPLPDPSTVPSNRSAIVTPSVSLTDDSGSDDAEGRRRELSPSPEVDLSPPEFDDVDDDVVMPMTPIGSLPTRYIRYPRDLRRDSPPLEKDEREFTQTADVLQKRKLSDVLPSTESSDRTEYGYRDDAWFGDSRSIASSTFLTSPAMRPSSITNYRKDDEAESWSKLNKLFEWDRSAESIEIDELDYLLDGC